MTYAFGGYVVHSTNQVNQTSQNNHVNQTSGCVTIVKVGGNGQTPPAAVNPPVPSTPVQQVGYTRRAKLGDSRSTGRLHTASNTNTHRSMTRLNIAGKHIFKYIILASVTSC